MELIPRELNMTHLLGGCVSVCIYVRGEKPGTYPWGLQVPTVPKSEMPVPVKT